MRTRIDYGALQVVLDEHAVTLEAPDAPEVTSAILSSLSLSLSEFITSSGTSELGDILERHGIRTTSTSNIPQSTASKKSKQNKTSTPSGDTSPTTCKPTSPTLVNPDLDITEDDDNFLVEPVDTSSAEPPESANISVTNNVEATADSISDNLEPSDIRANSSLELVTEDVSNNGPSLQVTGLSPKTSKASRKSAREQLSALLDSPPEKDTREQLVALMGESEDEASDSSELLPTVHSTSSPSADHEPASGDDEALEDALLNYSCSSFMGPQPIVEKSATVNSATKASKTDKPTTAPVTPPPEEVCTDILKSANITRRRKKKAERQIVEEPEPDIRIRVSKRTNLKLSSQSESEAADGDHTSVKADVKTATASKAVKADVKSVMKSDVIVHLEKLNPKLISAAKENMLVAKSTPKDEPVSTDDIDLFVKGNSNILIKQVTGGKKLRPRAGRNQAFPLGEQVCIVVSDSGEDEEVVLSTAVKKRRTRLPIQSEGFSSEDDEIVGQPARMSPAPPTSTRKPPAVLEKSASSSDVSEIEDAPVEPPRKAGTQKGRGGKPKSVLRKQKENASGRIDSETEELLAVKIKDRNGRGRAMQEAVAASDVSGPEGSVEEQEAAEDGNGDEVVEDVSDQEASEPGSPDAGGDGGSSAPEEASNSGEEAANDGSGSKDSSASDDGSNDDDAESDSGSEDIKMKRRKNLVLSTDSEEEVIKPTRRTARTAAKTSRKTLHVDNTLSSGDEFATKSKKNRSGAKGRKRRVQIESESDVDENYSDSDSEVERKLLRKAKKETNAKKKAKRDSDSESDNSGEDGSPKKGRKNIRNLKKKKDLDEATLAAQEEEEARKQRLSAKKALTSELEVDDPVRLILDVDKESKEPILEVLPVIAGKMKKHQREACKFLFDCILESVSRADQPGGGAILAHCMGLGKTLSVISLLHTLWFNRDLTKIKRILVLAPLNTVNNWKDEWYHWVPDECIPLIHTLEQGCNDLAERADILTYWYEQGGVMIMGYDRFRSLANNNPRSKTKGARKLKHICPLALLDPGPDVVCCDEGHILKNAESALSQIVKKIKTRRRIVLTGTPLQNNLLEYHCMVDFVKPNLLGTKKEFTNRFANPISNGEQADSMAHDVRIMKRRVHVLYKTLETVVQRKDYTVLCEELPPKREYILKLRLSELQDKLYKLYLGSFATDDLGGLLQRRLFVDLRELSYTWNHPYLLLDGKYRRDDELERMDVRAADQGFVTSGSSGEDSDSDVKSGGSSGSEYDPGEKGRAKKPEEEEAAAAALDWWDGIVTEEMKTQTELSTKFAVFFELLRRSEMIGDKMLVFSKSVRLLDMLENLLDAADQQKKAARAEGRLGTWKIGSDYFRIDGSVSQRDRSQAIKQFNRKSNTRGRLFLISTRAGGMGINLIAANRIVVFDVSWNPADDHQAIFRAYRYGQTKEVFIYRLVAAGTMEEKIYERQVNKQSLSNRVIDEQQVGRHFTKNELAELYQYKPPAVLGAEDPLPYQPPTDGMLAEVLLMMRDTVADYIVHDSLIEHRPDEELTEEERAAAWEEYEREKQGRVAAFTQQGTSVDATNSLQSKIHHVWRTMVSQQMLPPNQTEQAILVFEFLLNSNTLSPDDASKVVSSLVPLREKLEAERRLQAAAGSSSGVRQGLPQSQAMSTQQTQVQREHYKRQMAAEYQRISNDPRIPAALKQQQLRNLLAQSHPRS